MKKLFFTVILAASAIELKAVFKTPESKRRCLEKNINDEIFILLKTLLIKIKSNQINKSELEALLLNISIFAEESSKEVQVLAEIFSTIPCEETDLTTNQWLAMPEDSQIWVNNFPMLVDYLKSKGCSDSLNRCEILKLLLTEILKSVESEMEVDGGES